MVRHAVYTVNTWYEADGEVCCIHCIYLIWGRWWGMLYTLYIPDMTQMVRHTVYTVYTWEKCCLITVLECLNYADSSPCLLTNMSWYLQAWDTELASIAQMHADQCKFEHDCTGCRKTERYSGWTTTNIKGAFTIVNIHFSNTLSISLWILCRLWLIYL